MEADEWKDELLMGAEGVKFNWRAFVVERLVEIGCSVEEPSKKVQKKRKGACRFVGGFDVMANGKLLEISVRWLDFDCPYNFPHNPIVVNAVDNFVGSTPQPFSILYVSRITGAIISLRASTKPQWSRVGGYDFTKGQERKFYTADKQLWTQVSEPLPRDKWQTF